MRKTLYGMLAAALLCGCGTLSGKLGEATDAQIDTLVVRIADAIEPRLEKMVDAQIEREERALGIWGTEESYFYAERKATESDIRATAEEMVATWSEELRRNLDAMIDAKLKGGK